MVKAADRTKGKFGFWRVAPILLVAPLLAACQQETKSEVQDARPVRTVITAREPGGETVVLTGHVEAQNEAAMSFRIGGRMIERPVNVGDTVKAGQILAKLDPVNELNALRSAQAALAAAQGQLVQASNAFDRQQHLLGNGFTTRANFDQAQQARQSAQSQLDDAEAQLEIAHDRVSFTELKADVDGTITARGAEPGEVVQPGQMIVQLARQGGRDAVFDVPAQVLRMAPTDPEITIRLTDDPNVSATGRVREVAPQANAQTRTFPVRVGINNPPATMLLGSTVTGTMMTSSEPVIAIPATALTTAEQNPAVWVVDPSALTVSLRNVDIVRHDPATVIISHGLDTGEIVVTAGVQALHPGQKVRLLGSAQ
ncbi:efflux RND transporter periplasmic adaptor subunit [Kaistia dalseonensis]|uniref:RND family efflux transporter MFP subunit n=1 Tax=Kaistia dalseonensis TaxID=410840 RepID=A0ABU0H823_9HYPH|nr:efflux RND transporter periplasmic adaptor subunit [Kaistia dalseonensis]MCX5495855.1 efflux RND transporter periplasmic adaptor subunit [Kaistia dalseonensis]MDQ0438456.1 RND family efflux transporter MFP subunit [Kaistia dalseonensis]